jgi:ABC-2 type transport system ATP-binding protein
MLKVRDLQISLNSQSSGLSFNLESGEILGLIGKNSSGKSELLKCLVAPALAQSGTVSINNVDAIQESLKYRHLVGYLPSPVVLEPHLTGIEFLELIGGSYELLPGSRTEKILELSRNMGCHSELYSLIERLPHSVRQKIAIIATLVHSPKVLLYDEPWQFLDWSSQEIVTNTIKQQQMEGKIIVVASNDLNRLEEITKQYLVLDEGSLLAMGTLAELANTARAKSKSLTEIWRSMEENGYFRN